VSLVNAAYNLSGHPGMEEQVMTDEHLVRSAGRRFGRAGSMHGLAPARRGRGGHGSDATAAVPKTTKRRWAR
jgi:hypothetical protein